MLMAGEHRKVKSETLREIAERRRLSWTTVRTVAILAGIKVSRTGKTITVNGNQIKRLDKAIDDFLEMERQF